MPTNRLHVHPRRPLHHPLAGNIFDPWARFRIPAYSDSNVNNFCQFRKPRISSRAQGAASLCDLVFALRECRSYQSLQISARKQIAPTQNKIAIVMPSMISITIDTALLHRRSMRLRGGFMAYLSKLRLPTLFVLSFH